MSKSNDWFLGIIISILMLLCTTVGYVIRDTLIDKTVIPAIEVYRGNTELIISYKDTIPIDTIVVYKQ